MDLLTAANGFCGTLASIVNGTMARGVDFDVMPVSDLERAFVLPRGSSPGRPKPIPIVTGPQRDGEPRLWLSVSYLVGPDSRHEHLAVFSSFFSLVIDKETNHPTVRIEFERERGHEPGRSDTVRHKRPAAHVQIHGSSEPIAFVQGLNGDRRLRGLEKFHVPVGGRRYRPTLEDFIEFVHLEGLVPRLHEGWEDVVAHHRSEWFERQLRSAIRNDSRIAADQLTRMGYSVEGPLAS